MRKYARKWPKRYCLWIIHRCGQDGYEFFFDTFTEVEAFIARHPGEPIEVEDRLGQGGNIAKGIWLFN